MPTININSIAPGTTVYVNGIVDFSRITSRIEGKELEEDNARKVARGMRATDKPHTRLSISNASIAYEKGVDANGNPIAPTLAEQFIAERFYQSKRHPNSNLCYTGMNKSPNLPEVYCRESALTTTLEQVNVIGELASGMDVTLLLRFFATKQNNGVSLDAVIVNEKPVRFGGNGNAMASILATRGFQVVSASEDEAYEIRNQLEATPAPTSPIPPVAAPYMQPAQAAVPVAPAVNTAMPVQAVAAAPAVSAAVPVQAVAAAPAVSAAVPVQVPVQMAVPVAAGNMAPAPMPAAAPVAPSLPIPPKGYTYDDDMRIVPERAAPAGGITLS